jgi:hypothetical protein
MTRSADRPVVPLAWEILAISKVKYMLQSSKPAALLLKNQRDEMKLNDH